MPDWSAGDYVMFVLAAFQTGLVGGWKVVAAVTTLAGGSVAAHAVAIREFTLPWAVLALLVIFATVFAIGACTLYREVHAVAVRFAPSWEPLQERADTLWALYNSREDGPNADTRFRARFAATHSVAAQQTLDEAAKAGYPVEGVTRDDIRHAGLSDLPTIAAAFVRRSRAPAGGRGRGGAQLDAGRGAKH